MKQLLKFWPIVIVALVVSIGAGLFLFQSVTAKPAPLVLPQGNILYLAPVSLSTSDDIPGSTMALQAEGIRALHEFGELRRVTDQGKPDAIILHQLSLPQVDKNWIMAQYRKGIIIAAINVKIRDLVDLVDDPKLLEGPPDTDAWYKKPFYSFVGRVASASGGTLVGGTNNINDREGNLQRFLFSLRLAIKDFKSTH